MMIRRHRIRTVLLRVVVLPGLVAALLFGLYQWPLWALAVLYVGNTVVLIGQYVRRVFRAPESLNPQGAMLVDLVNAKLSLDPPLTRVRRYVSAIFLVIAQAVLWPRNLITWMLMRPLVRRNHLGQYTPKVRQVVFFYIQYALHVALFALLLIAVVVLIAGGNVHTPLPIALVSILAGSLFARHFAMVIFPGDLKVSMRRMPGDPRVYFLAYLIIDSAAFAAIIQFLAVQSGALPAGAAGFMRAIANVMSISEVRALWTAIQQGFEAGNVAIMNTVLSAFAGITPAQAIEMLCSCLVYLNIVRMLFPLESWKQTDEDLRFLAGGMLMSADPELAGVYLKRVRDYDVETAQLDAQIAAARGDIKAAAGKLRWAHARNALQADHDLVFVDMIGALIIVPNISVAFERCVEFALETDVSDVTLAVLLLFVGAIGRGGGEAVLQIMSGRNRAGEYPLSVAAAELWTGHADRAREVLRTYVAGDAVATCATIMMKEIASSTAGPGETISGAADEVCKVVAAVQNDDLSLSHQLLLISILSAMRCAVASVGVTSAALRHQMSALVTRVSELHPSHRQYASFLESYGGITETQALREARLQASSLRR